MAGRFFYGAGALNRGLGKRLRRTLRKMQQTPHGKHQVIIRINPAGFMRVRCLCPMAGLLKKIVFKFHTLRPESSFWEPVGAFFAYAEPHFYRVVIQERTPQPNREDDMEVVFIILSLAGLALALKQSAREEKRYQTQMAECRNQLLFHLERCGGK